MTNNHFHTITIASSYYPGLTTSSKINSIGYEAEKSN